MDMDEHYLFHIGETLQNNTKRKKFGIEKFQQSPNPAIMTIMTIGFNYDSLINSSTPLSPLPPLSPLYYYPKSSFDVNTDEINLGNNTTNVFIKGINFDTIISNLESKIKQLSDELEELKYRPPTLGGEYFEKAKEDFAKLSKSCPYI